MLMYILNHKSCNLLVILFISQILLFNHKPHSNAKCIMLLNLNAKPKKNSHHMPFFNRSVVASLGNTCVIILLSKNRYVLPSRALFWKFQNPNPKFYYLKMWAYFFQPFLDVALTL